MTQRPTRISITVCTRERLQLLESCLSSLLRQDVPPLIEPVIVVVENGRTEACQALVHRVAAQAPLPWRIVYGFELELGIPQARNRSLRLALEQNPDWIAFVDDDETAESGWLMNMIKASAELNADVLQGPVRYIYPAEKPNWLDEKEATVRPRGTKLRTAYTNNTIMKSFVASAEGLNLRFDESMRFTGGSDSDFFFRAADLGATIKWVDDAWMQEVVTKERLSFKWQLSRALRVASNASVIQRKRGGPSSAILRYLPKSASRLLRGIATIAVGAVIWPIGSHRGQTLMFTGSKAVASAIGSILGLIEVVPQPYAAILPDQNGSVLP